jgi:membrane protein YqaA with SNARE-associated domain
MNAIRAEIVETAPASAMEQARATRNPIRKLYFWTLHWAATRHALPALVGLSFAESSFFPVPPDVLLIAMTFAAPRRWARYALWCSLASIVGGAVGYGIGWGLWDTVGKPIVDFYHGQAVMDRIQHWYDVYGFSGILVAAITPIPYKVFTIASGWFHFDFGQFMLASSIGRPFRFFLVAGLIGAFGERVKPFLEEKLEWALLALGVLGIGGFVAIKYLG